MDDAELMEVLHAADDLLEELAGFSLLQLLFLYDIVEKLAATDKLHDKEELLRRLNDFEQLDDVRVPDQLQNIDLTSDSLYVSIARDFALFKNFDGDL